MYQSVHLIENNARSMFQINLVAELIAVIQATDVTYRFCARTEFADNTVNVLTVPNN